ncbi:MAG: hypothetical protein QGH73_12390 [Rhodospirillales bacterium]|jgi:hypothetical protein|nr:hypothetical protein [Rhodospirillales bacterium]MDP6646109.1 hypothetical protein [Rhodospirillales bacterium]MDP6842468.1 hypothetical protein [Rhodospirillales bacterium]|tara:strand:- start:187 stop:915 length:729 start_codon:yes stop_codon:yes gene_type:complete
MLRLVSASAVIGVLLAGCQSVELPTQKGMGNIHGRVAARPHKDYVAKAKAKSDAKIRGDYDTTDDGSLVYNATMVNYDELDEVYVGVIGANRKLGSVHAVKGGDDGFTPSSVALAVGDVIRINNAASRPLTFFLAGISSDTFDELPVLAPGASGDIKVTSPGRFELAADEDERISAEVMARPGMAVQRLSSGGHYVFRNLKPGTYKLIFWYWRLGSVEREVVVAADRSVEVSATLAVDTVVR